MTTTSTTGIKQLVVALTDPASADREIGWSAELANALQVPVHLAHVVDPARGREPVERSLAMAEDLVGIAASDARLASLQVTYEVVSGLIDEELPALAASRPQSVLLIAAPDGGLSDLLRGGGHGAPLSRLRVPYILLPAKVVAPRRVTSAIVGNDGSEYSAAATAMAAAMANRLDLSLTIVRAIEPGSTPGPDFLGSEPVLTGPELRVRGRGGQVLAAVARARDAGLIIVGSHGKGQMTRLLLGSTSEWLAHNADRPILIVPASAEHPG